MADNVTIIQKHKKRVAISKRDQCATEIAMTFGKMLNRYPDIMVMNALLDVLCGMISVTSNNPDKDLRACAQRILRTNWKRHKKLHFAAQQGISPEEMLKDEEPRPAVEPISP